jgi:acetolactate synthase-1/2/3 large subunit
MTTLGEKLIHLLEAHGVDTVFGIPGVHTVELYRGLANSRIRHITPRHEQGAGFMADGYARASGRPGVAFVITGPGLTNIITAMGQARADSVPMLVISGVNARDTLGKGLGHLHELPDQRGMMAKVALFSERIEQPNELPAALARAFQLFATARPGPVHIEIPTDVMTMAADRLVAIPVDALLPEPDGQALIAGAKLLRETNRPLILAGGGARGAEAELRALAERLGAPVVTTANARGLMHRHPLAVHAGPSLSAVRRLVEASDVVLGVGTEFGPTDYDGYADGGFRHPQELVRIDIDAEQLDRLPAKVRIVGDAAVALRALTEVLGPGVPAEDGPARAAATVAEAHGELSRAMKEQVVVVEAIRDALPRSIIVGDSTQPVYAANLWYDHDRPGGWFNAATGFGALGFGTPAAIGAALACPHATVVCLTGDGGLQFTLPELGAAVDAGAAVIFIVWNNRGYREIETSMTAVGVEPVGVSPAPPDFSLIAAAYGLPFASVATPEELAATLRRIAGKGPALVEYMVD